ncbi:hypothetical protein AX15_001961 [Amanita polypyramis BW_CC]|nr:hypothetical protein AX15_001961 [Amanita polypyramis BW_CC]
MYSGPDTNSLSSDSNVVSRDGIASVVELAPSSDTRDPTLEADAAVSSLPGRGSKEFARTSSKSSRHSVPSHSGHPSRRPPSLVEDTLQQKDFTGPSDGNNELKAPSPTRSPTKTFSQRPVSGGSSSLPEHLRFHVESSLGRDDLAGPVTRQEAPYDIQSSRPSSVSDASEYVRRDRRIPTSLA